MPTFSQELFDTICDRIANGESLRAICRDKDMPHAGTVCRWLSEDGTGALREQYARAKDAQADCDADDIKDIALRTLHGEFDANSARVAIDALKWTASKLKPKKYGDRLDLNHSGELTINLTADAEAL